MGEHSEEIAASGGGGENGLGSQAHYVGISPEEDRCGTKGTLGEVEGGITVWEPAASMGQA
jgi:hypothetical protein